MNTHLYHNLMTQIEHVIPNERQNRKKLLAWLLTALYLGKTPLLNRLAGKIPGSAKKNSKAERLRRFLNNRHFRFRVWYKPVAESIIDQVTKHQQPIRLLVDGSRVGNRHQLLMVAVWYRNRALPIAWTWVRHVKGHSSVRKQEALLAYVRTLIGAENEVILLGDSEFGSGKMVKTVESWRWRYVLRVKSHYLLKEKEGESVWCSIKAAVNILLGQTKWLPLVSYTQTHQVGTNLVATWAVGEKEPWYLVTNLESSSEAIRLYKKRMGIEEMFGDFKKNGFDLESSRLRYFMRLSRLTMCVAMLYVFIVAFGADAVKRGYRHLVDRKKQRQLSIFRIGFDLLDRRLTNREPFKLRLRLYV